MMIRPYNFLNKKVKMTLTPLPNLFWLRYMRKGVSYLGNKVFRIPKNYPSTLERSYAHKYKHITLQENACYEDGTPIEPHIKGHGLIYNTETHDIPALATSEKANLQKDIYKISDIKFDNSYVEKKTAESGKPFVDDMGFLVGNKPDVIIVDDLGFTIPDETKAGQSIRHLESKRNAPSDVIIINEKRSQLVNDLKIDDILDKVKQKDVKNGVSRKTKNIVKRKESVKNNEDDL